MICNRNGITSVGRWEFVKAFVEDFVAILVAIHFATPFATKNDRENFVEISSKISLLQLKFDEISTKFWTKFRRFFFVAKCCGKTFCHKAPDEKSDEILTKWKRKKQQRKSLYQNILQVVGNHGGVRSQYIYIYIYMIYLDISWYIQIHSYPAPTRYPLIAEILKDWSKLISSRGWTADFPSPNLDIGGFVLRYVWANHQKREWVIMGPFTLQSKEMFMEIEWDWCLLMDFDR